MSNIKHISPSEIREATKGSRGSYIDDAFIPLAAIDVKRIVITSMLARAMLATVGWTLAGVGCNNDLPAMSNKEYVCVEEAGGGLDRMSRCTDRALFVYLHDFTFYLYSVGF
jgi:hypothetical protein